MAVNRWVVTTCVLAAAPVAPIAPARADSNDIVLNRLSVEQPDGTFIAQNAELRSLASQLGVVLAPRLGTPADTLGFGGFQVAVDYATTTIDPGAAYWRAREGSPDPAGTAGMDHGPSSLSTIGLFARKGLWFPVPAFEVGAGAVHLVDSTIWTGQFYAKLALHEGYHQWPIPSFSVRGGVSRMMQQRSLDLTVVSLDGMVSKHFGIGGTWRLDPYAGYNILLIVPRSEVIDPTPTIDPLVPGNEGDSTKNFVFKEQDNIVRHRVVVGTKLQYYVLQLTVEASFASKGSSLDDRPGVTDVCMPSSSTANCDAKDTAKSQTTLSVSAGLDF